MSRVDFAFGAANRLHMACGTTARHVRSGRRLLVFCTDPRRMQRFDALLWSLDASSFIPHAPAGDPLAPQAPVVLAKDRSEEHTSELQSLMRLSYAVFCLRQKK